VTTRLEEFETIVSVVRNPASQPPSTTPKRPTSLPLRLFWKMLAV